MPNPMTNTVILNKATSSEVSNRSATAPIPGVMTAEEKATAKQTQPRVMVMSHLRAFEKFLGSPGSSGPKVTSLYCLVVPPCVVVSFNS